MSKLKAVIFDMDGVIIDSEPIYFKIERDLFSKFGIDISIEEHHTFVGMTMEGMWQKIRSKYNLIHEIEELKNIHIKSIYEYISKADELPVVEYLRELIQNLINEDIKIAVASSSPKKLIEIILTKLELKNLFNIIISGEEVEKGKPHPDIFLYTAEKLCISPKECVVIEDSRNGVKAAKEAGMISIGFRNTNSGNQDLSEADFIVDSMKDITIDLLKNLINRNNAKNF